MKYLDNTLLCFGPIFLNCVFILWQRAKTFLLKEPFLVSPDSLAGWGGGENYLECWSSLGLLTRTRIIPESSSELGHKRITCMILIKGRRQTNLLLENIVVKKMEGQLTTDWNCLDDSHKKDVWCRTSFGEEVCCIFRMTIVYYEHVIC